MGQKDAGSSEGKGEGKNLRTCARSPTLPGLSSVIWGMARRWFVLSGLGRIFIQVFDDVLHDQSDSPVGRIKRVVRFAQLLIGEPADLGYLI
jgi:hypothetical protein